jgi:hypothetical protein
LEDIKQDKRALEEELGSFQKQTSNEKHALEEDNKRFSNYFRITSTDFIKNIVTNNNKTDF